MKPKLHSRIIAGVAITAIIAGASAVLANEASDRIFDKANERFERNDFEEAAFLFEQAVIADPAVAKIRFWLGRSYWENDEVSKAQRAFNQTISLDPLFQSAFYWGGLADLELDEREAAEEKYESLVRICVDCSQALELRAALDEPEEEEFLDLFSENNAGEGEDGGGRNEEAEENPNGNDDGDGDGDDSAQ